MRFFRPSSVSERGTFDEVPVDPATAEAPAVGDVVVRVNGFAISNEFVESLKGWWLKRIY